MKNKAIIIILVIALAIAVLAVVYFTFLKDKVNWFGNKETQTQTMEIKDQINDSDGEVSGGVLSNKKEFTDSSDTYSIQFPKDWVVVGKDKLTTTGVVYDLALIDGNDINTFIGINGPQDKDQAYETNLQGLLDLAKQTVAKAFSEKEINMEIVKEDIGEENNYFYTYIETKLTKDDKTNYQIQKNIIGKEKLIVLTATIPGDKYQTSKSTIDEIINSLELK